MNKCWLIDVATNKIIEIDLVKVHKNLYKAFDLSKNKKIYYELTENKVQTCVRPTLEKARILMRQTKREISEIMAEQDRRLAELDGNLAELGELNEDLNREVKQPLIMRFFGIFFGEA